MTRKLYDENAYTAQFTAKVLSCEERDGAYLVALDATAFFPEGGGQAADGGTLNGIPVTDVQLVGDTVIHTLTKPLTVGETVQGEIDWATRFSRMQQHTGEHMLSGLVHSRTGYHNVGFHMGADCTTVDFSGKLSDEEIALLQREVNRLVQENLPVHTWYPTEAELQILSYRSKKEIDGALRLVKIAGVDLCACCAPHVSTTGQVGPVLILGRESIHGGTRLQMLCGSAATDYLLAALEQNKQVAAMLSAKPLETAAACKRLGEENGSLKLQLSQTAKELTAAVAEANRGKGNVLLFRESGDASKLACAVAEVCGGKCAVFLPTETGFRYAVAEQDGDLSAFVKELNAALQGRGGGRGGLVSGTVTASRREIEAYFGSDFT